MNQCLHCVGVANATGREIQSTCPGHQSSIEIQKMVMGPHVTPVSVSMVLHVSHYPVKIIAQKTGQSIPQIAAIMAASAKWHKQEVFV